MFDNFLFVLFVDVYGNMRTNVGVVCLYVRVIFLINMPFAQLGCAKFHGHIHMMLRVYCVTKQSCI